jgi:hypothetical protein
VYDLNLSSLYSKKIGGKTYWYLREMARVNGKPKMVSERYVGSAADVAALLDAREQAILPDRTRHLAFGDVAAAWAMLTELGVVDIVDEVVGPGPAGLPLSTGTYLALAALNRLVDPCSKAGSRTGGRAPPRTGSPGSVLACWTTGGSGTRCMRSAPRRWSGSGRRSRSG